MHASSARTTPHRLTSTTTRQLEVDDDNDEAFETCTLQPSTTEELNNAQGDADSEFLYRIAWDSSTTHAAPGVPGLGVQLPGGAATSLKEQGSACLRAGDLEAALACYSQALRIADGAEDSAQLQAILHSNRSHVYFQQKQWEEAAADALEAHRLLPTWPKPLYRLARAQLAQGLHAAAAGTCLKGESLCKKDSQGHTQWFTPLLDQLAVEAALGGSMAGFTGTLLEVREAGQEAWLGKPAPYVPELDGPQDEDSPTPALSIPALPSTQAQEAAGALASLTLTPEARKGGASSGDALAAWDYRQTAAARERRRTSFRSLKEAVAAARDGDKIVLRRGTHNGMGEAVTISKRVLIYGEGRLGETVIDQRANSPTFRITRGGVVIRNLDIDMSGFCEAVMVAGPASVQPLLEDLVIKCSGDDAVNVCGQADPTFRRCTLAGKKCGARVYDNGRGTFQDCLFEKCGEQGVKAMEAAAPTLQRCALVQCLEEGVVAMECSRVGLLSCTIKDCKGPGVDCSGKPRGRGAQPCAPGRRRREAGSEGLRRSRERARDGGGVGGDRGYLQLHARSGSPHGFPARGGPVQIRARQIHAQAMTSAAAKHPRGGATCDAAATSSMPLARMPEVPGGAGVCLPSSPSALCSGPHVL